MSELGVQLRLLVGKDRPEPAPAEIMEAFQSAEVTPSDRGPTGFQLTFSVGRSGTADLPDYSLLSSTKLEPFSRVILTVRFGIREEVLVDGYVTDQQLNPGNEPGTSTLTLTGEDVSVKMDLQENTNSYPDRRSYAEIVKEVIRRYGNLFPEPLWEIREAQEAPRNQKEGTEHQSTNYTDREYVQALAQRNGHVFYVTPGPEVRSNGVYWGPPKREEVRQKALSANMGPHTNVESIDFRFNILAPNKVTYTAEGNEVKTIDAPSDTRLTLSAKPAELRRTTIFSQTGGLKPNEVGPRAQAMVDRSLDDVVSATGELDALRYGGLLRARGLVELRGVGGDFDGDYYVKSVSHSIRKGELKQRFTLTREGTGALNRRVRS
jgi:hypothetical protein